MEDVTSMPATPTNPPLEAHLRFVPKPISQKLVSMIEVPNPQQAEKIARPKLLGKGAESTITNLFVKVVIGKEAHIELKKQWAKALVDQDKALVGKFKDGTVSKSDVQELSHEEVAAAHLESLKGASPLDPLSSQGGGEWVALKITRNAEGKCNIEDGRVCPTSERALGNSTDLNNVYVRVSDKGHVTITCGVINTRAKADEFIAAVQWVQNRHPETKLRINMHQLNSMGSGPGILLAEKGLVEKQHELVSYINAKLAPGRPPIVAHTNRCLNGFTRIPGEDSRSHPINQEGIALQMRWLREDLGENINGIMGVSGKYHEAQEAVNMTLNDLQTLRAHLLERKNLTPKIVERLEKIDEELGKLNIDLSEFKPISEEDNAKLEQFQALQKERKTLKESSSQISSQTRSLEKEIDHLEKKLKTQNRDLCRAMHALSKEMPGEDQAKVQLAVHILALQTGLTKELKLEPLSPMQELALHLLLDEALGTVTEINCKSGLDRTGLARSLQAALQKKLLGPPAADLQETVKFIIAFEANVKKMDAGDLDEKTADEIKAFQQTVLEELQNVAIPITQRSSGLRGLKWHWGIKDWNPFKANPHPVNWLPAVVDGKPAFTLKDGKRRITDHIANILSGLSPHRGG